MQQIIFSPLAQCVFLALVMIGCLSLFISVKLEIARVRSSVRKSHGSAEQEQISARREEALRMQDRGESAATIAAALQTPRNEIDLLLKIQKLSNDYRKLQAAGQ